MRKRKHKAHMRTYQVIETASYTVRARTAQDALRLFVAGVAAPFPCEVHERTVTDVAGKEQQVMDS